MHCDDKRTLFVLKQGIEETWEELKKMDFGNEDLIKNCLKKFKNILNTRMHHQVKNRWNGNFISVLPTPLKFTINYFM